MALKVTATVIDIAKNDESLLFALGFKDNEFYFIRKEGNDFGFFDFLYHQVVEKGGRFDVELKTLGRSATLVVPKTLTDIRRDGVAYIIDTTFPAYILDPSSISGTNQIQGAFARAFMRINPFFSPPCLATKEHSIGIYIGDDGNVHQSLDWPEGISPQAMLLNDLLNGNHDLLEGRPVHLVINPTGIHHDPVFHALAQQFGRKLSRHAVKEQEVQYNNA